MDFNIYVRGCVELNIRADALVEAIRDGIRCVSSLNRKDDLIMATLADIQTAMAAEDEQEAKVLALLQTTAAALQTAISNSDPVAIQAIADHLNANAATMAAAIAAAAPPAPVP